MAHLKFSTFNAARSFRFILFFWCVRCDKQAINNPARPPCIQLFLMMVMGTMARDFPSCWWGVRDSASSSSTLNFLPCKCRVACALFIRRWSGCLPSSLIYNNIWPARSCLLFIQLETITWSGDQSRPLSPVPVDMRRSPLLQCAPAVPGEGTAHERTCIGDGGQTNQTGPSTCTPFHLFNSGGRLETETDQSTLPFMTKTIQVMVNSSRCTTRDGRGFPYQTKCIYMQVVTVQKY